MFVLAALLPAASACGGNVVQTVVGFDAQGERALLLGQVSSSPANRVVAITALQSR